MFTISPMHKASFQSFKNHFTLSSWKLISKQAINHISLIKNKIKFEKACYILETYGYGTVLTEIDSF